MGGGTFTGVSLTPVILRWDFTPHRRIAPWFQAAGGLIYTTHKFPPDVLVPARRSPAEPRSSTSLPRAASASSTSSSRAARSCWRSAASTSRRASLGDKNPGVNASVEFQVGYTWWSRK